MGRADDMEDGGSGGSARRSRSSGPGVGEILDGNAYRLNSMMSIRVAKSIMRIPICGVHPGMNVWHADSEAWMVTVVTDDVP